MNSGPTSERVYDALKQRVLSGDFHPGERLDPAKLAGVVSSSVTPVREALNILTGETLVTTGQSEGFHIPALDEPAVRDLYAWNLEVLMLALKSTSRRGETTERNGDGQDFEKWTMARLSNAIAEASSNAEHLRAVRRLNDRLSSLRLVEPLILATADLDVRDIAQAWRTENKTLLTRLLTRYHRRRQRAAAEIVRARYRRR